MGSEVGIIVRKIRLAMTVVMESWITCYSLDPMVLTKQFSLLGLSVSHWETFFLPKCACLGAYKYLNL